jgi:hypothetical protein
MTANWVPVGLAERGQRCFGVWATVGSTGRWPETVNVWEMDGWAGLVRNFEHEFQGGKSQDPSLVEWWAQAASFRRGGFDRICTGASWSRPIDALIADGVRGDVYAHELFTVPPGRSATLLDALRDIGVPAYAKHGLASVAAFDVAMVGGTEAIAIWAIPSWVAWGEFEAAEHGAHLAPWRMELEKLGATYRRIAMVDAPLAPLRIGRQPQASDRRPFDEI